MKKLRKKPIKGSRYPMNQTMETGHAKTWTVYRPKCFAQFFNTFSFFRIFYTEDLMSQDRYQTRSPWLRKLYKGYVGYILFTPVKKVFE